MIDLLEYCFRNLSSHRSIDGFADFASLGTLNVDNDPQIPGQKFLVTSISNLFVSNRAGEE
jgi:hypothetical protein